MAPMAHGWCGMSRCWLQRNQGKGFKPYSVRTCVSSYSSAAVDMVGESSGAAYICAMRGVACAASWELATGPCRVSGWKLTVPGVRPGVRP